MCEDLPDVITAKCYEHEFDRFYIAFCLHLHLQVSYWRPDIDFMFHSALIITAECIGLECDALFQWRNTNANIRDSSRTVLIKHRENIYGLIAVVLNWRGGRGWVRGAAAWSLFSTQEKWSHYIVSVRQLITVFLLVIIIPLQADSGDWKWSPACPDGSVYMKRRDSPRRIQSEDALK